MSQSMQQMRGQAQRQRSAQPLTAVVHADADGNRQLEFPDVDKPATQNGQSVAATARVTTQRETNPIFSEEVSNGTSTFPGGWGRAEQSDTTGRRGDLFHSILRRPQFRSWL